MQNSIMNGMDFKGGTTNLKTVVFQFQESLKQNLSVLRQLMSIEASNKMVRVVMRCHLTLLTKCSFQSLLCKKTFAIEYNFSTLYKKK